jgi:hypothetical protein
VQARALEADVDGIPVTGHSLRATHATTAAVNGAPIDRITDPTETSARPSTTTSDPPKRSRPPRAGTSVFDAWVQLGCVDILRVTVNDTRDGRDASYSLGPGSRCS